ncbi:MAG: dnaJ [Acidimicrobiales bacterium]|nr:dnaJ [Acidimicrobiales bacterium]
MTPSASTDELRVAYRALARRLHPDRLGDASAAERRLADRRMREINEAWQVLQDPAARRRYDDSRMRSRSRPGAVPTRDRRPPAVDARGVVAAEDDDDLVDVLPPMTALGAGLMRHLPWVVLVGVFGLIFVVTAYATAGTHPGPTVRPPAAAAGACIDVEPGPSAKTVPCSGPHDFRVVRRVADASSCPAGTSARRLDADGYWDCVQSPGTATTGN